MTEPRARVGGVTIFTKLDQTDGDYLIGIKKGDEWKAAIRTWYGHYEYKVIPFGLVNALTTCQAMINSMPGEGVDQVVVVYLDDILIYSKILEEHKALVKRYQPD